MDRPVLRRRSTQRPGAASRRACFLRRMVSAEACSVSCDLKPSWWIMSMLVLLVFLVLAAIIGTLAGNERREK